MITVDDSRLPLIEVTFVGEYTDEAFCNYLDRLTALVQANPGSMILFNALEAGRPTPVQRQLQSDWLKEARDAIRTSRGLAFAISSPLLRGALTTLLWMTPLGTEHRVARTLAEADAWIQARFERDGIFVPPRSAKATL